jgi:hypothetical protein
MLLAQKRRPKPNCDGRPALHPRRRTGADAVTDPQVALMMLGIFIFLVFLGFPIAFTLMALGIGFGYYAYFDPGRHVARLNRLEEDAGPGRPGRPGSRASSTTGSSTSSSTRPTR